MGNFIFIFFSSFQLAGESPAEINGGLWGGIAGHSRVAIGGLVQRGPPFVGGLPTSITPNAPATNPRQAHSSSSVKTSGMSVIRESLFHQGISHRTGQIFLASWRPSTTKQYDVYIRRRQDYCVIVGCDSLHPDINYALDFLTELFHEGLNYSSINIA